MHELLYVAIVMWVFILLVTLVITPLALLFEALVKWHQRRDGRLRALRRRQRQLEAELWTMRIHEKRRG